jgi:hypothetical protein
MSTNVSHLADNILPATQNAILVVDITAASVVVDLMAPANVPPPVAPAGLTDKDREYWMGRYVTLQADGGDFYFYFADNPTPIISQRVAGFGTGRQSVRVLDGQSVDQLVPFAPALQGTGGSATPPVPPRRYLHIVKAIGAGTVFVNLWPSSTRAMLCAAYSRPVAASRRPLALRLSVRRRRSPAPAVRRRTSGSAPLSLACPLGRSARPTRRRSMRSPPQRRSSRRRAR